MEHIAVWLRYGFLVLFIGEAVIIGWALVQLAREKAHPAAPGERETQE